MLELKPGTGISEHGIQSVPPRASTLHSRSSSFGSRRNSSAKPSPSGFPSPLPSDVFEPQADLVLRPSARHLAERIFKRLMKLRKRALLAASCFPLEPSRAVRGDGVGGVRSYSLDSVVDLERGYDSDEQSGFVGVDTPTSSSSCSSSFESLAPAAKYSHKPGSQMMANMLLSLLKDEASRFTVREDDDECGSGDEGEEYRFGGPRESAWHQPEDEILTDQEWRMMRCGHLQGKPAATKKLQSSSCNPSFKYLAMGEYSSSKLQPTMAASSQNNSSSTRSKRETPKHM